MESVSQFGEHEVLLRYMEEHPPSEKFFVDIGAFGMNMSNTWNLAKSGWKGILIDADPDRIGPLREEFDGCDVQIVCIAVSDDTGLADLHLHRDLGHSSLLEDWFPEDATEKSIKVATMPADELFRALKVPKRLGVLSIDTEGIDHVIMRNLMFCREFLPDIIVTECTSYGGDDKADQFYNHYGYERYLFTGNIRYGNIIYVRKEDSAKVLLRDGNIRVDEETETQ